MVPYFDDGQITIFHGDCRDILPTLPPVDLVLTDPPYGVNKRRRTYAVASGPVAEWDNELALWWTEEATRVAPLVAFTPGVANIGRCPETIGHLRYRWTLAAHIVNGMTRGDLGYGNWIPCLIYVSDTVRLYSQRSDVQRIVIGRHPRPDHPCPKPYEAILWMLGMLPGQTVLDPFMGSGTTLRAAKDLGRRAIGIEIEERYCEIAVRRLAQQVFPWKWPDTSQADAQRVYEASGEDDPFGLDRDRDGVACESLP